MAARACLSSFFWFRARNSGRRFGLPSQTPAGASAPTGRYDLISCRNLLIYLDREVQEALILGLRRALRPGGFLVLGSSETVLGRPWRLLEHVSPALRIYRCPDH